MGKALDKFILLMWKNFLLQWRHPIQTAVEVIAPVLFACLLVVIRSLVDPVKQEAISFPPFESSLHSFRKDNFTIPWSPQNDALQGIMEETLQIFKNPPHSKIGMSLKGFPNRTELEKHLKNEVVLGTTFAAIDFGDAISGSSDLPEKLSVTIRFPSELDFGNLFYTTWRTFQLFPLLQTAGPRSPEASTGPAPGYEREGFLFLQKQLSFSIINYFKKQVKHEEFDRNKLQLLMQRFSYCEWTDDVLMQVLQTFVGVIFMLSFVYTCINTVKVITTEKEKQLKEAMKIMGLPGWLHWLAWFVKTFVYLCISVALMVVLLKVKWYPNTENTIFTYSDPSVIFVFLITFITATITFCFAISVFFSKANTAATVAGIAWFVSYFPYSFTQESYESLSLIQKLSTSIFSNTAMAFGFQLILTYEGNEEGIQWNNVWKPVTPDEDLLFGHILVILVIDSVLYLIIALYVEAVFPGEYGVPQKWYFPFTKSFWCGTSNNDKLDYKHPHANDFFEKEPTNLKTGIEIKHISKEFQNKTAVHDLSLNMYEGQITVLLGHNGAGKTTTMSMLTGMLPPSSGTALVNNYDIRTNINGVRDSLGLCPQHNILFDEMTVNEHLYFYSRLKGLSRSKANNEIEKYVELLELKPKATAQSSTLSGGMKRKLSVAVALCGDSSVVLCDEPTAGMDPSARRALWDLLQTQKQGRTILLTTHFMDEADLLGDRIAIMAEGKLQCCGSSFFLKKKYGAGYHLIMDISSKCNPYKVTALLKKYIPNIEIESNIGFELTYILSENHSSVFEEMLHDLETQSNELGINTYGISLTTLEEVFMKVGASNYEIQSSNGASSITVAEGNNNQEKKVEIGHTLLKGSQLRSNQIMAMFMKRGLSLIRSWILLLIQNFIPIFFVVLAVISIRQHANTEKLPSLKIELSSYDNPITVVTRTTENYASAYLNMLRKNKHEVIDWGGSNMSARMIMETREHTNDVRSRYIVGADFMENNTITAFFNNNPFHSPPLALQTVVNAILQAEVTEEHAIQFYNYPLPFTTKSKLQNLNRGASGGFGLAFNLAFAMAFTTAFYVMFYVRERVSKSKHLQFVSGIGVIPFWCTSFLIDLMSFIVTALLVLITFAICQEEGFKTVEDLGHLFAIFMYFGVSVLPLMYLASYLFDVPSTGYTRMALFNVIFGVAGFLGVLIMSQPELELLYVADPLHWVLLFVPQYSFSAGIRDIYQIHMTHHLCDDAKQTCIASGLSNFKCKVMICSFNRECCTTTENYYDLNKPGIGRNVIISIGVSILLVTILLGIEYRLFDSILHKLSKKQPPPVDEIGEDDDVAQEKKLIRSLPTEKMQNYKLVMRDVTKYYKNFLSVNSLCLGVKDHECFGLLGVNGAGKTTTFKMLTGDVQLSYGDAWVNGLNLKTEMKTIHQLIGYCPQFDALLDDLTARETLVMYGMIRGITGTQSKIEAEHLAHEFDFYQHLDKQIKSLSGGNKRKVSTAIALIGDPQVIYLDEPTTGMDPATKRYIWNALCKVRDNGKCIILTSHSMEECEALCTRLSIMVNGTFKCLGSTQHLKNKFSEGYTLTVKRKKGDIRGRPSIHLINEIETFVRDNFKNAVVREQHQELITFHISDKSLPWSKMFGILERGKRSLDIEDYSLGQSSLEQVFLTFTKQQR